MNRTVTDMTLQAAERVIAKIIAHLTDETKKKSRKTMRFLQGIVDQIRSQIDNLKRRLGKGRIEPQDCKVTIDSANYYQLNKLGLA